MKRQSNVLLVFALLDVFLLGLNAFSAFSPMFPEGASIWFRALIVGHTVFLLSLAASAYGLATVRTWGFILSYVQFPLRIVFMHTSFGYLLMLAFSATTSGDFNYQIPAAISIVLETIRLVVTIILHRQTARLRQATPGESTNGNIISTGLA